MFVAWDLQGERVAGQVLCRILKNCNGEVFEVSVGLGHRRKGLARFLLLTALHELRFRGVKMITLGTRAENPTEAWRLYESVGFETQKGFLRWRKARDQENLPNKKHSWIGIASSDVTDLSERVDELLFADGSLERYE